MIRARKKTFADVLRREKFTPTHWAKEDARIRRETLEKVPEANRMWEFDAIKVTPQVSEPKSNVNTHEGSVLPEIPAKKFSPSRVSLRSELGTFGKPAEEKRLSNGTAPIDPNKYKFSAAYERLASAGKRLFVSLLAKSQIYTNDKLYFFRKLS